MLPIYELDFSFETEKVREQNLTQMMKKRIEAREDPDSDSDLCSICKEDDDSGYVLSGLTSMFAHVGPI